MYVYLVFRLSFKQGVYFVYGENRTEIPVLELTYPASYPSYVFPIIVAVDEIDITATGKSYDTCMYVAS